MHLSLEVLASASIKRKKPWPQLTWVGKEKESLLLMDHRRLSLLYLPSGKTKRKINKVNKMLPNTLCMNTSRNGSYLAGLLTTGEVFVWHKDTDLLRTTAPLPNMEDSTASSSRRHLVYISNEGGKILVVRKDGKVHIWQKDDHSSHLASPQKATGKITELSGRWYEVGGGKTQLPEVDCKEVAIDAVFFQDQVQGNSCRCSFVFNNGRTFTVSTAYLHWHEKADSFAYGPMPFVVTWMVAQRPLAAAVPDSTLIRSRGAYLACYTNDGQVLAVACNQWQPKDTKVMFVSVFTSTAVEANMSSCGAKTSDLPPKILRTYWICGMRWTCDDLLLVCITKRGSVVILTRLGEPVTLTTHGCSVEMGPSLYLPLHPLIMYSPGQENIHPSKMASNQSSPPSTSEIDPLKQRFSIATHPRLPIILCSDGYMVTVMQLPSDLTTPNVLKTLCVEANQVLSSLGVRPMLGATLTKVFGQGSVSDKGKSVTQWRKVGTGLKMLNMNRTEETNSFTGAKSSTVKKGGLPRYSFEEPTDSGDLSQSESDVSTVGANVSKPGLATGDEGKIFFGDHDLVNETVIRPEKAKTSLELAEGVSSTLLCAWGLSLSYSGQWTWELEVITRHIADCLVKLVSHLLQDEGVRAEKKKKGKTKKERSGVSKALVLFRHALNMTDWDSVHQHCLPCVVRMVHGVTGQLLGRVRGHDIWVRGQLESLAGCQHLLRFAEERLNRAYVWNSGIGAKLAHGSDSERLSDSRCQIQGKPGQKLAKSWKLLYNLTVKQYLSLKTGGSARPSEQRAMLSLLGQLQHQLQTLGCGIARTKKARPDPTNQILLSGDTTQALHQWEEKLKSLQDKPETPQSVAMETVTLLSILYTHLLQYNLGAALLLVQSLIDSWDGESSTNQGPSKLSSYLAVEGGGDLDGQGGLGVLRKAARPVVRTLARFMAAYFSNRQLYVYPPHAAKPLPPVHQNLKTGPRATPLHHTEVSSAVRRQSLSDVWTADFTMELLLLCGQAPEAVWLASQLGDWKGAFMLAVSYLDYLKTTPVSAKLNQSLQLPDSLQPLALLQVRLMSFLSNSLGGADTNSNAPLEGTSHALKRTASTGSLNFDEDSSTDQVCRSLQDLFTVATVAGAEAVPWLLERVVRQMQAVCSRLSTEVPAGLYLPAPPLYLPQPASTSEEYVDPDVRHEKDLRREMAHLTQLALVLLQAAGCQLPCARWYLQQLLQARQVYNKKIKKLPSDTLVEMPEGLAALLTTGQDFRTLHGTSQPQGSLSAPSQSQDTLPEPILKVVSSFRRLCGLLWMLEARERLSLCGRKLQSLRERTFNKPLGNNDNEELELCKTALDWALNMLPFADYLDAEDDLQDIVLSLVGELPMTRTTGDILADHFYDPELLSPTVEEKWNHLQTKMRKTRISVDQTTEQKGGVSKESKKHGSKNDGKTAMLSVYFHKKSGKQKKEIKKKAQVFGSYETQVFSKTSSNEKVCVGSWPFETDDSYLFFLETFFSVAFGKAKQEEKAEKVPLLGPYKLEVREREVNSMAHKAMLTFQHKSLVVKAAMSFLGEASHKDTESKSLGKKSLSLSCVVGGKTEGKRLFKSRSVTDVNESETICTGDVIAGGDDGKSPKRSLSQRRAASLSDLGLQRSPTRSWVSMTDLRPKGGVNLGGKFNKLTPLVEWLHRWSCKKNVMSPSTKDGAFPGGGRAVDSKAVIRVRVPPSLVLTSFWLMENLYFRKQLSSSTLYVPPQEYIVYPAFGGSGSGVQHATTSHESMKREETPASNAHQEGRQESKESTEENKGRKGRKQSNVKKQGLHETSSEGMSTEEAGKQARHPRTTSKQQQANKRGKSPVRVHASIPRHVLESPTEVSSSSWTPVLSSDSPTEEKVVPPPASMTSVTSMSPQRVEAKKKLSFASQPSTLSPEESIRSEDSSTFNISSLADDESQATPTGQPITIPTPGSHLTRERPVASSTPHSAYGGQRSGEQGQRSFEKSPQRAAQDGTVIHKKGQAGSKGKGHVTSTGAPVPSGSSSLPGFTVPKKVHFGSTVPGSPSSSVEDAVNNVKEMRQLVRSELRSILEVQHQNIVSLLNTSGTVNVVVGNNPGPTQVNTADRHTQVSQELQVAQLEHIAAQVSPTAPASGQVQNGPHSAAHNPGIPLAHPQMEPSIHNTQGGSHPSVPLLRFPGFPDYSQNPIPPNTREPSANPRYQNPSTFRNPHHYDNMTRPDNPGHNPGPAVPGNSLHPGFAVPESSLHPPGMPLLRLPPEIPFQRPVTVPFQAWGQNSVPAETHDHNAQASQDGRRTGWPSHLNLEQYDAELVNSVNKKGAKKDRGPLLPNNSKKSDDKPIANPTPQEAGAEGMGFAGAPGAFAPAMMPLLHLDNSYAPSQMMGGMYRMPQPQNNYPHFPGFPQPPIIPPPTDIEDVALRLPLLHLRDNPQAPSYQYSFAPGMPRLVPPEEIIAYEQKKHQTEVLKTHRRQTKKEDDAAARRQENLPLLQADIEPWDPKGDRENLNRQRRRMQKDSGVSQDAGKILRKGGGREKEDRESVTEDEDVPTHDEVPTPGVIVVQPSPGPDRTTQQTVTAQDSAMPRDQGYVIPPGTFDEYLEYQTVVPTPAQIHYDAVINKKAKPIMKTADTQTDKPDKDEGLDAQTVKTEPERERTKPQPTAEKETNTVIVVSRDVYSAEQAVSQYAASGMDVSRGGPGLPPDIFFNLRFGREASQAANSGARLTPSQMQDQEVQTPAFLNVVDIDNSLLKDLKPTKQPRQRQRMPGTGETVEEHRRSPAPGLPDDATPADLHYRLAGLTNSIKPAEVDDEGNIREPPVGDSLTVDLLSSTTGESPVNLAKIRRDTAGVRAKSRERLADKLTEMGRQLDAIDQMANNMEDDFKNTRLLVNTIDNLGEAIHPEEEEAVARRPRGRGQQYDSRHDSSIPPVIDEEEERIEGPVREKPLPSPILEEEEVDKEDKADRSDRVPIAAPKQADRDLERLLDMTGLSGVSDIIAEVFADGGLREEDLGLSLTGGDLTRDSMLPSEPFASTQLCVDTLQDVFSPRAQDTSRQEEDRRAKKRKEVQKWMLEKRTERRSEYLKQLEELRSTEHRPYKPAQDSPKQGATWKQIHQAEKEMEDRRKALLQENMSERVKQAYDLMGDIVIDTPELPASSLPPPSVRKKKPARPSSSARGSSPLRRGLPKSSTPIPRSQRMQATGFDVDEYDIDDDLIEELLQDSGEVQGDMLKTYKVRDVSRIVEQPAAQGGRRPKPFTKLVRQQRPESVRNQSTGKPKTYAEKLGDTDASKIPRPTFNKLKDKQRLYGAAGGGGVSRNRMQEVTRRGLPSEPRPREYASTYARYRANTLPNQRPGTGRRGGRVSPRQPIGKRFEGPRHKPKTYSQQLQDISAAAPKGRPRLAYTGTSSRGFKSPSMRTQTLRHAPYPDVYESVLEDISEASTASLLRSTSDDVRRILDEEDIFGDGGARPRYKDYPDYDAGSLYDVGDDILGDDYINSVDPDQLSQASHSTGSILSNINWDEVEQLIATVE